MKIYTRTGDAGTTGLRGGSRVPKSHPRVAAYGDVDELNSCIGYARSLLPPRFGASLGEGLARVQNELFQVGARLASPSRASGPALPNGAVARLESEIDAMERDLRPLKHFILPSGSPAGAWLHVCRCVSRRAERSLSTLGVGAPGDISAYLNRLSDYLFVAARWANRRSRRKETLWKGGAV